MTLCILAAGKLSALAVSAFTLSWTHSVERVEWREDWQVTPAGLHLTQARVKGSGAGMEVPDGARLENGWWVYAPHLPPQREVLLGASGATGAGWTLCAEGSCRVLGDGAGEPVRLSTGCREPG